jgi:hypothetical protein
VSKKLKALLANDVSTVKTVATNPAHKAWTEVDAIEPEAARAKLKKDLTTQIVAGEDQIAAQPMDF